MYFVSCCSIPRFLCSALKICLVFVWILHHLSYDLWLHMTSLVSSNFPYKSLFRSLEKGNLLNNYRVKLSRWSTRLQLKRPWRCYRYTIWNFISQCFFVQNTILFSALEVLPSCGLLLNKLSYVSLYTNNENKCWSDNDYTFNFYKVQWIKKKK